MSKSTVKKLILVIAVFMTLLALVLNIGAISGFFGVLSSVLSPVIIAFCLAFILNIPMSFFEKRIQFRSKKGKTYKGLSRAFSILLTFAIVIGAIAILLLVIIPQVTKSAQAIVAAFPGFTDRALSFSYELLERFDITPERISQLLMGGENFLDKVGALVQKYAQILVKQAGSIGGVVIGTVSDIVFGIFLAVYFLAQKDLIISQIKRLSRALFKPASFAWLAKLLNISRVSFSNFISGQFIEAVILGILCFLGMLIFRFPYAPVVSVLVGVSALIPIIGAWMGCGISALLILIADPVKVIWFVVFFLVLQQIEGNVIYPRVVGQRVGLPGVWVLMSVIIGNGLLGAMGALTAVPIASVLYVLLGEFVKKYESKIKASE